MTGVRQISRQEDTSVGLTSDKQLTKTDTDVTMDKLILQAKRLALVEMQLKIAEEVAVIDNLITDIENKNEDSIPF